MLAMLVALFLLDGLVVGLHIARQFTVGGIFGETILNSPFLDLSYHLGLAPLLGIIKLATAVLLGVLAFARSREPIYLCGAVALAIVLAFAGFSIHVPVGGMIGKLLPISPLYREMASYFGEAISLAMAGVVLLLLLYWGSKRSSVGHARLGVIMAATLVLLGLFAGGVDLVNSLVYPGSYYLKLTLQVVEEGGELFVVSIALMLMAVAVRCPQRIVGIA